MIFAEYQDTKSKIRKIVEYSPVSNIYSIDEYIKDSKIESCHLDLNIDQYLEYINTLKNNGYIRKEIF